MTTPYDAVLLIAYGGPESMADVRPFLDNVLRGKRIPAERVDEVLQHYEVIGGRSPLAELTRAQATRLQAALSEAGRSLPVYVGMRNWHPFLADTLREMAAAGARRALGIICSLQRCDSSWEQYQRDVDKATDEAGPGAPQVDYLDVPPDDPHLIVAAADCVREALDRLPAEFRHTARLVFTAHSIPRRMIGADTYAEQVRRAAELTAERLSRPRWQVAYQSRSGRPQDPWLEPDICAVLRELGQAGEKAVVVMPIGFVCDHVEVLYDLDIEAKQAAREAGVAMARARTVGTHPAYNRMLVEWVLRHCDSEARAGR